MGRLTPELDNDLAAVRRALGLTQDELARAVKVSRQTISTIEQGDYNPSTSLALRLAVLLGVPVERLFSLPAAAQAELEERRNHFRQQDAEEISHEIA